MYNGNKIIYKNISIPTMETLKALTKCSNSFKEDEIFAKMKTCEAILFQGQYSPKGEFCPTDISPFPQKRYSFEQMCETQTYLEALDFLECIKYATYTVNARQLIRDYLQNAYCLSKDNTDCLKKWVKENDILRPDTAFDLTTPPFPLPSEKNQPSPSKSIRQHLCKYLSAQVDFSDSPAVQCGLFSTLTNCCNFTQNPFANTCADNCQTCAVKRRFSLPVSEIPEFLTLFTFFDGRDFNLPLPDNKAQDLKKLSHYNKEKSYSYSSYCTVLKKIQSLFSSLSEEAPLYAISVLYRCDTIFLFRKANLLLNYYKMYSSTFVLDKIISNYQLTYAEIMILKKVIIENIFKDYDFIIAGLKSPYLDFMLPFDIFFQFAISNHNYGRERGLEADIMECKNAALKIFSTPSNLLKKNPLFFNEADGNFSISSNEQKIQAFLKDNPFYKFYYGTPDNFSEQFISNKTNASDFCPDFEIIKKALNTKTFYH